MWNHGEFFVCIYNWIKRLELSEIVPSFLPWLHPGGGKRSIYPSRLTSNRPMSDPRQTSKKEAISPRVWRIRSRYCATYLPTRAYSDSGETLFHMARPATKHLRTYTLHLEVKYVQAALASQDCEISLQASTMSMAEATQTRMKFNASNLHSQDSSSWHFKCHHLRWFHALTLQLLNLPPTTKQESSYFLPTNTLLLQPKLTYGLQFH